MAERGHGDPAPATTSEVDRLAWDPRAISGSHFGAILFADVDMSDFEERGASFDACTFRGIRFNDVGRHDRQIVARGRVSGYGCDGRGRHGDLG